MAVSAASASDDWADLEYDKANVEDMTEQQLEDAGLTEQQPEDTGSTTTKWKPSRRTEKLGKAFQNYRRTILRLLSLPTRLFVWMGWS